MMVMLVIWVMQVMLVTCGNEGNAGNMVMKVMLVTWAVMHGNTGDIQVVRKAGDMDNDGNVGNMGMGSEGIVHFDIFFKMKMKW